METYNTMKARHQKELDNFKGIGFAFSNEQFTKMCEKLGIKEDESKDKLYSIGMGGYVLKEKSKDFHQMFRDNEKELKEAMQDEEFVYSAFNYELANHEYAYTYELEPTLEALGITVEDLNNNKMWGIQLLKATEHQKEQDCWN